MASLLKVEHLCVGIASKQKPLLSDISFSLKKHNCLGIVGESGSGKSLTCKAITGLLDSHFYRSGDIWLDDLNLTKCSPQTLQKLRGETISMILQHPMAAFDPTQTVGDHMVETLFAHRQITRSTAKAIALQNMEKVKLNDAYSVFSKYPTQISGGMLQRVMIAIALSMEPKLLIADEPTTALDSVTQFEIMQAFKLIREKVGTTMLFISHDFGVINQIADNVIVMNQGTIVEQGSVKKILHHPQHEYSQYLVSSRLALQKRYQAMVNSPSSSDDGI